MAAASDKKMQLKVKKKETEVKNNELWELISITSSGNSISNQTYCTYKGEYPNDISEVIDIET